MTEERAEYDAATPGPIDPMDGEALRVVMWQASNRHARDIQSFINDWEGTPPDGELHLLEVLTDTDTATAVARAVCPEHHAVYDTRMHVAVPAELVRTILSLVQSLLPTDESEATS